MSPGGAASGRKGAAYERELVNAARGFGWGALRLGGSGSGTTGDRADILLGRPVEAPVVGEAREFTAPAAGPDDDVSRTLVDMWLVEAKSGSGNRLYVEADEVDALRREAGRWGAKPRLSARSTERGRDTRHYLVDPSDCPTTDDGNYALVFENAGRTDDPTVYDIADVIVFPGDPPLVEVRA